MHLLILGGSAKHAGGTEAFCARATEALLRRDPNWHIHHIASETAYLTVKSAPKVLRQLWKLFQYRKLKPDVTWLQFVNLPDLIFLTVAKLLGMRVMVTPHLGSNWRSQKSRPLRWLSRLLLALADRLALISNTQRLEIALPTRTPRSLIRTFLPETIFTADLPIESDAPPELRLIHAARLSIEKGSFMVIEVSAKLSEAGIPVTTRIAGGADADTRARLNKLIAAKGLAQRVNLLGRLSEDTMMDILRTSDVLVHLSSIDSYPLIVLEAMACGAFPIAMELAGARDMIETYDGVVVGRGHAVEDTVAFLAAADLADLRKRGCVQAARVREDYNWNRCAGALEAALMACIAGSRLATEPASV
jgi:glycosyltransferase involved in cell wall biosynthesis